MELLFAWSLGVIAASTAGCLAYVLWIAKYGPSESATAVRLANHRNRQPSPASGRQSPHRQDSYGGANLTE